MRFTQLAVLAASVLAVSAAPGPGLTPEGLEEFYKIVNAAHESPADADLEKRCCSGVCCDYSNCVTGVAPCIYNCANIPNAGGVAGCIAGTDLGAWLMSLICFCWLGTG
ncbi:predicted protein [Aspergillus terreus NIH2624]|uniref:Uncharacterized protein n=1 Tax=Aspergillus terreus (strain NIH 2624 / FGSC A1156) TaxID=341663 RepID=Q0CPE6_ASPTN|nr:uncharacterized protein ATEG_04438 [Aspergillus terreus NIH2624]EAU34885.1 predicted protein [Aspergillus terreus NIH2624]